ASLALLDEVSNHLDGAALFLALTFRARDRVALATVERPSCIPIPLTDLSPASARQMLHHLVGTAASPQAVEQHLGMRDREGRDSPVNPLFLEEALNVMMGAGVLRVNGRVHVDEAELSRMQVPDTIHGLLLARLDRLPPAGRDLLQVASVIGRQFSAEPLQVIAQTPLQQTVLRLLTDLSEAEMTRLVTADPEWIYLFQHAMTHEVAYESLPYARRQFLHAAVASWLAQKYQHNLKPLHSLLAYHYSRADNHPEALQYAILAADEARNIFANREAIDLYTLAEKHLQALADDGLWETAVHLYLSRGNVLILLGDLTTAFTDAEKALELAQVNGDQGSTAVAYNLMAEIRYRQGAFDEVQTLTQKVIDSQEESIEADQLARAYIWAGWAASSKLDHETGLKWLQKARDICARTNNNYRLALALEAIGFVYYGQRNLENALEAMQQSVDLSRDFSTPVNIGFAQNNVAFIEFEAGRAEDALKTFDEAVALGRTTSRNLLAITLYNQAAVYAYLGQFASARANLNEALELLDPIQHSRQMIELNLYWGYDFSMALKDYADARMRFETAKEIIDRQPEYYPEERARLLIGLGQLELAAENWLLAHNLLVEAKELIEARQLSWWAPAVHYYLALVHVQAMDLLAAKEELLQGLAKIEQSGCPDYKPLLLIKLAEIATDDANRFELISEAVAVAERRARFVDRITCLKKAGELLLRFASDNASKNGKDILEEARRLESVLNF
ncbi:MAG: tetratricopeptide repeat protein, partial [Anaerolineales bacterium]|nr:tetratricopeptide repeat protein [Anaerolineales bacterium]